MSSLDDYVRDLQEEIDDMARRSYGEKGLERWRNPRHAGRMDHPDGAGRLTGSCGDSMEIYLRFGEGRVIEATYFTTGCASSSLSGSFAAELALGRTPEELTDLTAETILGAIGRLPEEDAHCAKLAAETVREALHDYMVRQLNP
jgi:nitrogen fixation NifU-like protein